MAVTQQGKNINDCNFLTSGHWRPHKLRVLFQHKYEHGHMKPSDKRNHVEIFVTDASDA
jgi:hypothetical protein